jgi:hypothetical protein
MTDPFQPGKKLSSCQVQQYRWLQKLLQGYASLCEDTLRLTHPSTDEAEAGVQIIHLPQNVVHLLAG